MLLNCYILNIVLNTIWRYGYLWQLILVPTYVDYGANMFNSDRHMTVKLYYFFNLLPPSSWIFFVKYNGMAACGTPNLVHAPNLVRIYALATVLSAINQISRWRPCKFFFRISQSASSVSQLHFCDSFTNSTSKKRQRLSAPGKNTLTDLDSSENVESRMWTTQPN